MAIPYDPNSSLSLAQQQRDQYLRTHDRDLMLRKPKKQQVDNLSGAPDLPGQPVCDRCVGAAIDQAVTDRSQWTDRPKVADTASAPALPTDLLAMKEMMQPETWQAVLMERGMLLVRQESAMREFEARERAAAVPGKAQARAVLAHEQAQVMAQNQAGLRWDKGPEPEAQEPKAASELDQALEAANASHQALDAAVGALESRLGRIMRPIPEEKAPNACPMMAPLPMEIMAIAACTMDEVDRLHDILDRLAL